MAISKETAVSARASRWVAPALALISFLGGQPPSALACSWPLTWLNENIPTWDQTVISDPSVSTRICGQHAGDVAAAVHKALSAGGIVFLGEVHDNPLHHKLRGQLLAWLQRSAPAAAPALVFEHIRADQMAALDPPPQTTDALFAALKWDEGGWPDTAMFAPLFQQVIGRALVAGEPAHGRVRDIARQGLAALPAEEAARLKLDVPLAPEQQDSLLTELEASHCGLMPKSAFGTMALAQRYRDAFLAEAAMTAAASHGGAIVFTGNGHARRDRGAPLALKQRRFDKPILVVLFTESVPDKVDPAVADMIVSTAPATRKDPCEDMRARFGKKG